MLWKNKIVHIFKELLKYTIIIAVTLNIISYYKSQSINASYPDLKKYNITIDRSKPLLLHFWATWCPTCKLENSTINSLAKDHQVVTIAVNSKDLKIFMKKNDLNFNTIDDKNGFFSNLYNIQAFPSTLIFDKKGQIVFSEVGYTSSFGLKLRLFWASL